MHFSPHRIAQASEYCGSSNLHSMTTYERGSCSNQNNTQAIYNLCVLSVFISCTDGWEFNPAEFEETPSFWNPKFNSKK